MAWQDDYALINSWYKELMGRDMKPSEWQEYWGPKTKNKGVYEGWKDIIKKDPEAIKYRGRAEDWEKTDYAGKGWQEDKAYINKWYKEDLGRDMTEEEWQTIWAPKTKGIGVKDSWRSEVKNSPEGIAKTKDDEAKIAQEETDQEKINTDITKLGTDLLSGNIPGYEPGVQEANIESQYGEAKTALENQLAESAAGGGFETGGYYTSMAKGKAGLETGKIRTLADLNSSLTQFKANMALQGASLLSGLEEKKYNRAQYDEQMALYNQQMLDYKEALKKQQDEWWKPVLGGIIGAWASPGGAYAGASAGKAAQTQAVEPTMPSTGYYNPITTSLKPVGFGYSDLFSDPFKKNTGGYY